MRTPPCCLKAARRRCCSVTTPRNQSSRRRGRRRRLPRAPGRRARVVRRSVRIRSAGVGRAERVREGPARRRCPSVPLVAPVALRSLLARRTSRPLRPVHSRHPRNARRTSRAILPRRPRRTWTPARSRTSRGPRGPRRALRPGNRHRHRSPRLQIGDRLGRVRRHGFPAGRFHLPAECPHISGQRAHRGPPQVCLLREGVSGAVRLDPQQHDEHDGAGSEDRGSGREPPPAAGEMMPGALHGAPPICCISRRSRADSARSAASSARVVARSVRSSPRSSWS